MGKKKKSSHKNAHKRSHKENIKKLTSGILDNFIDVSLFCFAFLMQSKEVGWGRKDLIKALEDAVNFARLAHPKGIKRAIYNASQKGYLEKRKDFWQMTKMGKERLASALPKYYKKRPWDGKIYLIAYDIPEDRKHHRDMLRDYLKRLGCGMLQASVWLTPYNYKGVLLTFIKENRLAGLVIISEIIGEKSIGGKSVLEVVDQVFELSKLNEEYHRFIEEVERCDFKKGELIWKYLLILQEDPQLPYVLLPGGWWGDIAHKTYKRLLKNVGQ